MPLVNQIIGADATAIPFAYQKVSTEGDAYRFVSAEPGKEVIRHLTERTAASGSTYTFDVGFNYLVGQKQLQVAALLNDGTEVTLVRLSTLTEARNRVDEVGAGTWPSTAHVDPASASTRYWSEDSPNTIKVYNVTDGLVMRGSTVYGIRMWIPHTATPGELQDRIIIRNQGNNIGLELLGDGDGFRLRSRTGVAYTIRIGDNGTLVVEPS